MIADLAFHSPEKEDGGIPNPTVSSIINGGNRVTPHFGAYVTDEKGKKVKTFKYETTEGIVSEKTPA